jgi:hypothetical protein
MSGHLTGSTIFFLWSCDAIRRASPSLLTADGSSRCIGDNTPVEHVDVFHVRRADQKSTPAVACTTFDALPLALVMA